MDFEQLQKKLDKEALKLLNEFLYKSLSHRAARLICVMFVKALKPRQSRRGSP